MRAASWPTTSTLSKAVRQPPRRSRPSSKRGWAISAGGGYTSRQSRKSEHRNAIHRILTGTVGTLATGGRDPPTATAINGGLILALCPTFFSVQARLPLYGSLFLTVPQDQLGDCRPHVIRRQMRIPRRRRDLRVPQQLADHRQTLARGEGCRGEGVTQIVNAGVLQPGAGAEALPERLQINEPATRLDAVDHPWVARQARRRACSRTARTAADTAPSRLPPP